MHLVSNAQEYYNLIDTLDLEDHFVELDGLVRSWWELRWIPHPESVSTHTLWTLLIVKRYEKELGAMGADVEKMQKILLVHDLQEKEKWVWDITPHDNIPPEEKKRREVEAIERIFKDRPDLLELWYDYTEARTLEGRLCKEIDKLDAIEVAGYYERKYYKTHLWSVYWLVDEFYWGSIKKKWQIKTPFLLARANEVYVSRILRRS